MTQTQTETPSATPDDIFKQIISDAAVHGQATEAFVNNFSFYGRSLKEHSEELYIDVPDSPTPQNIRECYINLAKNMQVVSHFLSVATSISSALSSGGQVRKSDLVAVIIRSYEKRNARRPSGAMIERMAESYMRDTVNVRIAAKIITDFWKNKRDTLIEVRKCLEQISIGMSSELKYLSTET